MLAQRARIYPMNVTLASGAGGGCGWKVQRGIPVSMRAVVAPPLLSSPVSGVALASGTPSTHQQDLIYHGGKIIPNLIYCNLYLGGASAWRPSDVANIDGALEAAMTDAHLNNVMVQYFPSGRITSLFHGSRTLDARLPTTVGKEFLQEVVRDEFDAGTFDRLDLSRSIVNLLLPPGVILQLNDGGDGIARAALDGHECDAAATIDSRHGLGGFHGSVHIATGDGGSVTIYYTTGVFSARDAEGRNNGIVAFEDPWKNVVATFYHELNEARTDADVEDVIATRNLGLWGWVDSRGAECGDFPLAEAGGNLALAMQEVPLANGRGHVPIQLQYSNFVHGPEGPTPVPRPFAHSLAPDVMI